MQKRAFILFILLGTLVSGCGGGPKKLSQKSEAPQVEHELLTNTTPRSKPENLERESAESKPGKSSRVNTLEQARVNRAFELFTQEWEGVPHRMGGSTKKGVDCSGFVIVAYREVLNHEFAGRRAEDIFAELKPIEREDLQYGDLVFFKIRGRRISHVGIYLGADQFAHASSSSGVRVSALTLDYWEKRFFKGGALC